MRNIFTLKAEKILICSAIVLTFFLWLPSPLSAGPKKTKQILPNVEFKDLGFYMKKTDPFVRALAIYKCRQEKNKDTLKSYLEWFLKEKNQYVKTILLIKVLGYHKSLLKAYFNEELILEFAKELEPPTKLHTAAVHKVLTKALGNKWSKKIEKFLKQWEKKRAQILASQQKAQQKHKVKPIDLNSKKQTGQGSVVNDNYSKVKPLPEIRNFDGQDMDFFFALDTSGSNIKHFKLIKQDILLLAKFSTFINSKNRIGAINFCKKVEGVVNFSNDCKKIRKAFNALKPSKRSFEDHGNAIIWALENMAWKNENKFFLMVTDEPLWTYDKDLMYKKMSEGRMKGVEFHLLVPTDAVKIIPDLKFQQYLAGGGTKTIYNKENRNFTLSLSKFFIKEELRDEMEPFIVLMFQIFQEGFRNNIDD